MDEEMRDRHQTVSEKRFRPVAKRRGSPRPHGSILSPTIRGRIGNNDDGRSPGLWKFRVGDYRVAYRIEDDRLVVLVVAAGDREEIYDVIRRMRGRYGVAPNCGDID